MNPTTHNPNLAYLPTDVILSILEFLTLDAVSKLSRTCRVLRELVSVSLPSHSQNIFLMSLMDR